MAYRVLADMVVLVHFIWILFLFLGAFWGKRIPMVRRIHLAGLLFASIIETFNWYCPLTHLEVWLRARYAPGTAYAGSFIAHYLEQLIYIQLPRPLIVICTIFLGLFNLWLYRKRRVASG